MTIYGILAGLIDFTNIADFIKLKEDYFTELLGLEIGTRGKVPLQRKLTRYMLEFKNIEKLVFEIIPTSKSCQ